MKEENKGSKEMEKEVKEKTVAKKKSTATKKASTSTTTKAKKTVGAKSSGAKTKAKTTVENKLEVKKDKEKKTTTTKKTAAKDKGKTTSKSKTTTTSKASSTKVPKAKKNIAVEKIEKNVNVEEINNSSQTEDLESIKRRLVTDETYDVDNIRDILASVKPLIDSTDDINIRENDNLDNENAFEFQEENSIEENAIEEEKNPLKEKNKKNIPFLIICIVLSALMILGSVVIKTIETKINKEASLFENKNLQNSMYREADDGSIAETKNVRFNAYFLHDNNGDGSIDKVQETKQKVGKEDTLYIELEVLNEGELRDAKIEIKGQNFYLQSQVLKDDEIKENYIGSNITKLEFNTIKSGTQKNITGKVRSGDYTSAERRAEALENNTEENGENKIIFTATYINNGKEIEIRKEINLTVGWYGELAKYDYIKTETPQVNENIAVAKGTTNSETKEDELEEKLEEQNKENKEEKEIERTFIEEDDDDEIYIRHYYEDLKLDINKEKNEEEEQKEKDPQEDKTEVITIGATTGEEEGKRESEEAKIKENENKEDLKVEKTEEVEVIPSKAEIKNIFNISINKTIDEVLINGQTKEIEDDDRKMVKIEVPASQMETAKVIVKYKLTLKNTGNIEGKAEIEETIIKGFKLAENYKNEWKEQNGVLTKTVELDAGEEKEIIIALEWKNENNNLGTLENIAKINNTNNNNLEEENLEDNTSSAKIVIGIKTGENIIHIYVILGILISLAILIIIYKIIYYKKLNLLNKLKEKNIKNNFIKIIKNILNKNNKKILEKINLIFIKIKNIKKINQKNKIIKIIGEK